MATLLKKYYFDLVDVLPMDDTKFRAKLHSANLFPGDAKSRVERKSTEADKSSEFLDAVISKSPDNLSSLLEIMEKSEFIAAKSLAKKIISDKHCESQLPGYEEVRQYDDVLDEILLSKLNFGKKKDFMGSRMSKIYCNGCSSNFIANKAIAGEPCKRINPYGYLHEFYKIKGISVECDLCRTNVWSNIKQYFPGYSWMIIYCGKCNNHLGWEFKNEEDSTDRFYGILETSIKLRA